MRRESFSFIFKRRQLISGGLEKLVVCKTYASSMHESNTHINII